MIKKSYKFLILLVALIMSDLTCVYALSFDTTTTGYQSLSSDCSDCSFVYDTSSRGFRVSLFKYDGSTLEEIKVLDLVTDPNYFNDKSMYYSGHSRIYYNQGGSVSFSTKKIAFKKITDYVPSIDISKSNWAKTFISELNNYFGSEDSEIISKIKTMFGVDVSKSALSEYYLVVEPTIVFDSRVGNFLIYGTGYEYMNVVDELNNYQGNYKYDFWTSQSATIRDYLYNSVYVESDSSKLDSAYSDGRYDYYNFVSMNSLNNSLVTSTNGVFISKEYIKDNYKTKNLAYGISVSWLGYKAGVGCHLACSDKSGNELLECAENYCSNSSNVTDSNSKANCITDMCNYSYSSLSCDSTSVENGNDTTCATSTTSSKKTCEIVNKEYYSYKVECTTTSTVIYPTSLPTTIKTGMGFTYQVSLSGNKTCTITFDSDKWKFDYATSYTDSERNNYLNAISNYNQLSLDKYSYDSSIASIITKITEQKSGKKKVSNKALVPDNNYYTGSKSVTTTSTTTNITTYHNNESVSVNIKEYTTDSSNGTYYNLPNVCISSIDNETITEGDVCSNGYGPYRKYYTKFDSDMTTNNVVTNVNHGISGMDVENTCSYTITDNNDELACYISVSSKNGTTGDIYLNTDTITFTLNKVTESSKILRYNLGTSFKEIDEAFNNKTTYTINKNTYNEITNLTIYGTITDGSNITTCRKSITIVPEDKDNNCTMIATKNNNEDTTTITLKTISSSAKYYLKDSTSNTWLNTKTKTISNKDNLTIFGKVVTSTATSYCYIKLNYDETNTCTSLYKASEYLNIKNYCQNNYQNDTADYSSYEDCYLSCSSGNNTCKRKYSCSDTASITSYCQVNYQQDGYNSINSCINDCSCSNNGLKYYYRTISISDPFPNRNAHSNWLGYEEYITDDETSSTSDTPEYVIVLDSSRIKQIKNNTAQYNSTSGNDAYSDYIREDEDNTSGYKSKFIHTDDVNNGGFNSYFTYIAGSMTGG